MRTPRKIAITLIVAALATLFAAAPASADPKPRPTPRPGLQSLVHTSVSTTGINIRTCPSTSCASVGKANPTDPLLAFCFKAGEEINGTQYWDTILNQATGIAGYITEWYLTWIPSDNCDTMTSGESTVATQASVNLRSCSLTSCPVVGTTNGQELLLSQCWMVGTSINGNSRWDVVYATVSGRFAFITEYYLSNQSQEEYCEA